MQIPQIKIETKTPRRPSGKDHNRWIVPLAVVGVLMVVATLGVRALLRPVKISKELATAPKKATLSNDRQASSATEVESALKARQDRASDDGTTLWASPTSGDAISLGYLPPGCQLFLSLRPAALLAHAEGDKVLEALGPVGAQGVEIVQRTTGLPLSRMDRLLLGLRAKSGGVWSMSCVVKPVDRSVLENARDLFLNAVSKTHAGHDYWVNGEQAMWKIDSAAGPLLVVSGLEDMVDVIDLSGKSPPMRREMEELIAASDADRHVTLLFAPSYLFADGRSLFTGSVERLADPLDWFFGDGLTAVAISLHWDSDFFLELDAISNIATKPHQLAPRLRSRAEQLPEKTQRYLALLNIQPYGQKLVQRLPAMLGALVGNTRSGYDRRRAILRAYLPRPAGHNLLMASQLALVEPLAQHPTTAVAESSIAQSANDRLDQVMSLTFRQETLEEALDILAVEIGVEILLVGRDLQLDGITKNQSFGLDLQNRPARKILQEILRLANPDQGASGLSDPQQKLVYTVKPSKPSGKEVVIVTTRAAAARRGDTLPVAFRLK